MKKISLILLLFLSVSCRKDEQPRTQFVEPLQVHLTCGVMGTERAYSTPLNITMVNNTEQFTYGFESDLWGRATLDGLMPGQYTLSVSGKLTAEEAVLVQPEADGGEASLAGFATGVALRLGEKNTLNSPELFIVARNPIIFKEIYYAGSRTPSGGTYRNDNFYSVHNNSDERVDISDLYIGMCENFGGLGEKGPLWPDEQTGNYKNAYLKNVWKVTRGDSPVYMEPGQTIVIATMAAPHNKEASYNTSSPVDLSTADYEAYVPDPENTYPDFPAPNMELAFWPDYAYLWRSGVFGQGMVLIRASREEFDAFQTVALPETFRDPFESEEYWLCKKVPYSYISDAVDVIQNSTVTNTKRFAPSVDAGFASVGETYGGKSVVRKRLPSSGREVLQDTNNSTEDFEINEHPLS